MLNNSEYFNQYIVSEDIVKDYISRYTVGIDLGHICNRINKEIESKYKKSKKFEGYLKISPKCSVKFGVMFNKDKVNKDKEKVSYICINNDGNEIVIKGKEGKKVSEFVISANNYTFRARITISYYYVHISELFNGKEIYYNSFLVNDDSMLKIIKENEKDSKNAKIEQQQPEKWKTIDIQGLMEDLKLKYLVLDYVIDIISYRRERKKSIIDVFGTIPAYKLPIDITLNSIWNEILSDEYKRVINETDNEELKLLYKKLVLLYYEYVHCIVSYFTRRYQISYEDFSNLPLYRIIPMDNYKNEQSKYELDKLRISFPELYNHVLREQIVNRDLYLLYFIRSRNIDKCVHVCLDVIKLMFSNYGADELIKKLCWILSNDNYFGLKRNVILYNLKEICENYINPNYSEKDKEKVIAFVNEYTRLLTPELVGDNIRMSQMAQKDSRSLECHDKLVDLNIDIYEDLNKGYTLAKNYS